MKLKPEGRRTDVGAMQKHRNRQVPCVLNFEFQQRAIWLATKIPQPIRILYFTHLSKSCTHPMGKTSRVRSITLPSTNQNTWTCVFIKILSMFLLLTPWVERPLFIFWIIGCYFWKWLTAQRRRGAFVLGKYAWTVSLVSLDYCYRAAIMLCCVFFFRTMKKIANNFATTCAEYNNETSARTVCARTWFSLWANTWTWHPKISESMTSLCRRRQVFTFWLSTDVLGATNLCFCHKTQDKFALSAKVLATILSAISANHWR